MACCDIQSGQARMYKCHDLEVEEENRADTVKSRILTRLVQKHMMTFSGLFMKWIFDPYIQ